MNLFFSQWILWIFQVSSVLRLPSWSSFTASFICCSKSSTTSSMSSKPSGGRLFLSFLRSDMLAWLLLCWGNGRGGRAREAGRGGWRRTGAGGRGASGPGRGAAARIDQGELAVREDGAVQDGRVWERLLRAVRRGSTAWRLRLPRRPLCAGRAAPGGKPAPRVFSAVLQLGVGDRGHTRRAGAAAEAAAPPAHGRRRRNSTPTFPSLAPRNVLQQRAPGPARGAPAHHKQGIGTAAHPAPSDPLEARRGQAAISASSARSEAIPPRREAARHELLHQRGRLGRRPGAVHAADPGE
jgi:hypothetical protein